MQKELEEPGHNENWDLENGLVFEGRKNRTSVFSVRFRTAELEEVRSAAERQGINTGDFIRQASLLAARGGVKATIPSETPEFEALVAAVAQRLSARP